MPHSYHSCYYARQFLPNLTVYLMILQAPTSTTIEDNERMELQYHQIHGKIWKKLSGIITAVIRMSHIKL